MKENEDLFSSVIIYLLNAQFQRLNFNISADNSNFKQMTNTFSFMKL